MQKTQAIVLQAFRYGESSHVVRIFTRSNGFVSCMVKGSGRRSTLPAVLMQPFSLVDVVMDVRPNRQFQYIRECNCDQPTDNITTDPIKNGVAFFLCEFLCHTLQPVMPDEQMFDFVRNSIVIFNAIKRGIGNFHLVFLIKLTYFFGFFPNLSDFCEGAMFDLSNSLFVHEKISENTLTADETLVFVQLMRMDYVNMHLFALTRTQRNDILQRIIDYYRLHLPDFGTLKSLDVLKQLYS